MSSLDSDSISKIAEDYPIEGAIENKKNQLSKIVDYFISFGTSNFKINFWSKITDKWDIFIQDLFNYLIVISSSEKMITMDLFLVIYFDLAEKDSDLQTRILYIFYAALFEKENYKIPLAALGFFAHIWRNSESGDKIRSEIFPKLLDFIDNDDPLLIEEGIFETLKLLKSATDRERERFYLALISIIKTQKDSDVQSAIFDAISEILSNYIDSLKSYSPELINNQVVQLLESRHLKESESTYSILRLLFKHKISLKEDSEKIILKMLKKSFKKVKYETMSMFWISVYNFVQIVAYLPKKNVLKPFLGKLQDLFKHRDEIAENVSQTIEEIVTYLWDNNVLSGSEMDPFYT
jgi:hypothetical protein